jgi:protein phosphatase
MNLTNIYYLYEIGEKKNQEDYIWPVPANVTTHSKVFIVCDGVGGSEHGEIASMIVAEFTGKALLEKLPEEISVAYINELLHAARQQLISYCRTNGLKYDMATTFSLLVLYPRKAFVAWCGDSRVYHIRNGNILYKTSDHSLVNALVKKGELSEAEAMLHPQKNIILNAIKADDSPLEAEGQWITGIRAGDYFMLCTDGLLENISDNILADLLKQKAANDIDILTAVQQLCEHKTKDNYSMYLLETGDSNAMRSAGSSKVKYLVAFGLLLLAALAVVVIYYKPVNAKAAMPVIPLAAGHDTIISSPLASDTVSLQRSVVISHTDPLADFEKITPGKNTRTPAPPNIIKTSADTMPIHRKLLKTAKDSVVEKQENRDHDLTQPDTAQNLHSN